jgi:RHS repeat-associated protein
MKLKPILTAVAVALATLAQPVLASNWTFDKNGEPTHYKGIPLPPVQTVEEARAATEKKIAAIKAEEAKQAAQAATSSNLQSEIGNHQFFYTGKPYLEETGQYLFLFRHYDPELARWTTADPSGFPDGANNQVYVRCPTVQFDSFGLYTYSYYDLTVAGSPQSEINSFRDALAHYRSSAEGSVPAGQGLYTEMRADSSYQNRVLTGSLPDRITGRLTTVPYSQNNGFFNAAPGSTVGQLNSHALGSYGLGVNYTAWWSATGWANRQRTVNANVNLTLTLSEVWDFETNPNYNFFENLLREWIPGWIAGDGHPFTITGTLNETLNLSVVQNE